MAITLRAYDRHGNRLGQTVPWSKLARTIVRNAPGSITAGVPLSLITSGLLSDEVYLRVAEDGVEAPDWYVLDDDGDDAADEGGEAREVAIGGKGVLAVFDWATIYPQDHVPGGTLLGLKPVHEFNTSPGQIMATLIDRAKARGWAPQITYSFTATHDSAGRLWPSNFARVYEAGTTLLKVLEQFTEDAWADFEMTGFRLDLYVPDTALAPDFPDSVLRLGKGVTQAPRKRTRASVRSVLLANGSEGATLEIADPDAVAKYGRREGYEGRSGITDVGTLTAATQVSLARQTAASESITLAVDPAEAPPIPRPGGYLRYDQRRLTPTQLEPMRVQSVAWEYGEDPKLSVELADLWVDRDVRLERRVDAILNGSSANERVPLPPLGDEKPPSPVQGLSLVSGPYEDPTTGAQYAQATATWLAVTTDVDGTPVGELKGYTIEWRQLEQSNAVYRVDAGAGATLASWSPVVPGTPIEARIAAYDRWDNYSTWSPWVQIMAGVDETPPPAPTLPIVDNYLGLLRTLWDGGFVGGSARPADLLHIEVHTSAVSGFDPNVNPAATLTGTIVAGGTHAFAETPYGAQRYVKLVAVDTTGNRSAPSAEASGATGKVVEDDIFDGAVGSAKLASLAVKTAHIDLLAVNSAQVGSIEVGKLVAGTVTANILMGGRIYTAETGQRVELNSLGIFRYDAAGNQTVAIDDNGALLTGRYRTAVTGRRIEMGSAGTTGRIDFWSPDGDNGFVRAYTEASGTEAIQLGMKPSNTTFPGLWNLLNINASTGGEYALLRSGHLEFVYDTSAPNTGGKFVVFSTTNRGGSGAVTRQRLLIDANGEITLTPGASQGFIHILRGSNFSSSQFKLLTGANYGALWKVYYPGSGSLRMECRDVNDSGFAEVWASAFTVNSDRAAKENIKVGPAATGLLGQLRTAKVKTYQRIRPTPGPDDLPMPEGPAPVEIGLIAQEAPAQIRRDGGVEGSAGVDLYQMAAMTWGALAELADRVDALSPRGPS